MSRGRFIKLGAALGVGAAGASILAACGGEQASSPATNQATGRVEGATEATKGGSPTVAQVEEGGAIGHVFTYTRPVDGQIVEIETEISAVDFERLWSQRRETLQKLRYSWNDGPFHWDIDFFKTDGNRTYFIQAEVEMPEGQTEPPPLPFGTNV